MATPPVAPPSPLPELSLEEEQALLTNPMLEGVLPLHETSDMVLVIRLRRYVVYLPLSSFASRSCMPFFTHPTGLSRGMKRA